MIYDVIAGFVSGVLGAMGFGGGGILILYLTLYKNLPQLTAQGINLIFFIPSAIVALIFHIRNKLLDINLVLKFLGFSLIGLVLGYFLLKNIPENIIRKIFSLILITVGIKELFLRKK